VWASSSPLKVSTLQALPHEALSAYHASSHIVARFCDHLNKAIAVVWKLDRLSRSLKDLLFIVEKIRDAKATFTSLTEHLDTKGPGGTALMQMLGVFAEFEPNIIAERTKLGVRQAMADGKVVGRPAKLDAAQKKEVVRLLRAGQSTQAQIARMAKVNRSVISRLASKTRVEEGDHGALQKALRPL
jgi:DNA invertase Pin-like site-specific DNA recombinase